MHLSDLSPLILIAPLSIVLIAVVSLFRKTVDLSQMTRLIWGTTTLSLLGALFATINLISHGPSAIQLFGFNGLGISFRLDSTSLIMMWMIVILGHVILTYSLNYLAGDPKHSAFITRLATALASVQILVMSGNLGILFLAWMFTSYALQRLLMFYNHRAGALIAARKKFIVARMSDIALLVAVSLLYSQFGTGDLQKIFNLVQDWDMGSYPLKVEIACILLALAAIFKAAQLPTHGWLIDVMETPTPVSALLHAGLINAGPFLIIRMAYIFQGSGPAQDILMIIGGLSAVFGSVVYLTQTSIKTSLAYSSVAHMGFSLMTCGLGAYAAAMLHLVGHSFYKAHSFLSSGSVMDTLRINRMMSLRRKISYLNMIAGLILSAALFITMAHLLNFDLVGHIHLIFLSLIIISAMAQLLIHAMDSSSHIGILLRTVLTTIVVTLSFLLLEHGASTILGDAVPAEVNLSISKQIIMGMMLLLFVMVVFSQHAIMRSKHPRIQALYIHLRNGLYLNMLLDKQIGAWSIKEQRRDAEELAPSDSEVALQPAYNNS